MSARFFVANWARSRNPRHWASTSRRPCKTKSTSFSLFVLLFSCTFVLTRQAHDYCTDCPLLTETLKDERPSQSVQRFQIHIRPTQKKSFSQEIWWLELSQSSYIIRKWAWPPAWHKLYHTMQANFQQASFDLELYNNSSLLCLDSLSKWCSVSTRAKRQIFHNLYFFSDGYLVSII